MVHNYSSWGGNLATVLNLCRGLPAYGYEMHLAAPPGERYVSRFVAAGVTVHNAEVKTKRDVGAVRRYWSLIRRGGFQVVHTHTRRADFAAALAGRLAGAVVVSTQHGQINLDRRTLAVKNDAAARFYSFCLRNFFHRHVAVSGEIARELTGRCGVQPAKVVHIPNGIDSKPFLAAEGERKFFRHEIGALPGTVVATVVASLDAKGHRWLLPAVAQVVREGLDVKLVVVGEGHWGGPLIRAQAHDLGIADRVHMLGFREDIPRILAGSDVFVLPTPSEGCSLAILEAMAAALPVIASDVGGNPELVVPGVTGLLLPVEDVGAWATALAALARDPGRRRAWGQAGRARAATDFTLEKMVKKYAALYDELLTARGRNA